MPEDLLRGAFDTDSENLHMTDMHFKAYLGKAREAVKKFIESRNTEPGLHEVPVQYSASLKLGQFGFVALDLPPAGSMRIKSQWWQREPSSETRVTIGLDSQGLEYEITGTPSDPQVMEFDIYAPDKFVKWFVKSSNVPSINVAKSLGLSKAESREAYKKRKKIRVREKNFIEVQELQTIHPIVLGGIKNYHNVSHQPYEFFAPFLSNGDDLKDSEAPAVIKSFATLIKRGQSIDPNYLAKLNAIFTHGRRQGMSFWEALVEPLAVSMCSLNVIYHFEDRSSPKEDSSISGVEFANRLSYSLWRSAPDLQLIELGKNGKLLEPQIKQQQIQRMMKDEKFSRFLNDFSIQWLELQRQDLIAVDPKLFREFDQGTKPAMKNETIQFVAHLVENNLSLSNLIDSDFMVLNNTMARHYGIPNVYGNDFRAVPRKDHPAAQMRGGILTHAGILMQGGTGDRTSIVERGAFVARKIIDRAPAPPPPNAGELPTEEADTAQMTGAELVRHHAAAAQCANCHATIDPLGMGLEQFDAIGRLRTEETRLNPQSTSRKRTIEVPIETKGNLYDGKTFDGVVEMKQVLMTKEHDLARGFIKALVSFCSGRQASFADESIADSISEKAAKTKYLTRDIIEDVLSSKAMTTY